MKIQCSLIGLAGLAFWAGAVGAQGLRPGAGITDIMRAGPRPSLAPLPARPASAPPS